MSCPGLSTCRISCGHADIVRTYHRERQRQEAESDDMYASERANYLACNPIVTFKSWLRWARTL